MLQRIFLSISICCPNDLSNEREEPAADGCYIAFNAALVALFKADIDNFYKVNKTKNLIKFYIKSKTIYNLKCSLENLHGCNKIWNRKKLKTQSQLNVKWKSLGFSS